MNSDQIFGYIEKITFQNQETGFTVASLKEPKKSNLTVIVGLLASIQPGENVRCIGFWKNNSKHGIQFEVNECHIEAPEDLKGIQKYLASGIVKGIGPIYAEKIVKKFGLKTLEIIDQTPEKLLDVEGIGEKRVDKIKDGWHGQKAIRSVMIFLQKFGISPAYAHKIYKHYKELSIQKIQENPYQIASDISGIGFKKADELAKKMGYASDNPSRIEAGILYLLSECMESGHTCFPKKEFIEICQKTLESTELLIEEKIIQLTQNEKLVEQSIEGISFIWLKHLYLSELGIVREIQRLKKSSCKLRSVDTEKALTWVQKELNIELAENQKKAVAEGLSEKIVIITGGPGTGKSTITKAILAVTQKLSSQIILAAPTGRAAKRMQEITAHHATTIHSLLQHDFVQGGFKKNKENPIDCTLIIIDEASMVDTYLMYSTLKAIPNHARVIIIGDIHQLPSVGPGSVLQDLIESGTLSTITLTEIFRQAANSKIITNAHRINQGLFPDLTIEKNGDFFFVKAETPQEIVNQILHLVKERLPKFYRFNPIDDIQILCPMRKGAIGVDALNQVLQNCLNPQNTFITHRGFRFAVRDKVMQIRNNYEKEVYNGDIGKITRIDFEEEEITILFEDRQVIYQFHELDEIVLAYATSIHKYQGSERPCVIIPIHLSHFIMLHRNLIYTAVTRGKKLVVLVGTGKAIAIAVNNNQIKKRYTGLKNAFLHNSL